MTVTLYHGDCLEILPTLEAGSVDAVITDPPYGINWQPRVNHQEQTWKDELVDISQFLKIGETHLIWGANYYANILPISKSWLTWIKRPLLGFNYDRRTYSTVELAWTNANVGARYFVQVWDGGKREGVKVNRMFLHPAQKPLELMEWCIELITQPDDTILDPFMGSGTTGVACVETGRNFIGIEIDADYFKIAQRRIADAQARMNGTARKVDGSTVTELPLFQEVG